jgi:hypothetical protein
VKIVLPCPPLDRFTRCVRCRSQGALVPVVLECSCVRSFCTTCIARPREGRYLDHDEWSLGYARVHQEHGGSVEFVDYGRRIDLKFDGGRHHFFYLWQAHYVRPCGILHLPVRRVVRPALYQELAMLLGCPYSSGTEQRNAYRARSFRAKAKGWYDAGHVAAARA